MKVKVILIAMILLMVYSHVYGWFAFNGSGQAYTTDGDGEIALYYSYQSIDQLIIESAGHFFGSYSDMLLFLKKMELSELNNVDYGELQKVLGSSLESLERAKAQYSTLINYARMASYNPSCIKKLILFDYYGLQREKRLNYSIFRKVVGFLSVGDVTGAYEFFYGDLKKLYKQLEELKRSVDNLRIPSLSQIRQTNQCYSEMMLFAQYVAEVFDCLE
jgi:hypothetical protein